MRTFLKAALFVVAIAPGTAPPAAAQTPPPAHDTTALAKQTQNPVGDLVSVPFQFNFNTGGGLSDQTFLNLNIQPVIPIKLSERWNVIARTIIPVDSLPGPDATRLSGVGDIQAQLFFTPAKPGPIIWGVGPILSMPTSTSSGTATGTWAAGPAAVIVKMAGPWVVGGLLSQAWPMSDANGDPETDLFLMQPFVNFNFGKGWALTSGPVITANWNAPSGEQWTVPVGFGISRTTVFGGRPISLAAQYYYNVVRPDAAAGQQLRLVMSFLFPVRK
jgi:hypothetical protein